ncbi:neutral zinc metallopeptidase [Glaciihabitans arcticus]|uniref:Neutral zinc metallopeptidase n=1 Tax=Glaciihabitans arcticus TaxID=2668039 RepID=A0A4Q9GYU6_9MICO|nr:neutral zinc metallopeptidase [Glaciihabitans arcticus]TBN57983.1 neutral zinc metallopeptidase [Glaciihabitans arcticus]
MTFNDDAQISGNKVKRRGRGAAVGGGVGIVGVIVYFIFQAVTGIDPGTIVPQGGTGGGSDEQVAACTGEEANNGNLDCRLAGTAESLDDYWSETLPAMGVDYRTPEFILFTGSVTTGCGNATSASGPFYCPPDETVYIDTDFYADLESKYGASGGPLAQMYVLAHEWGHHVQNISGIMNGLDLQTTGPASDGVRLEVQADCFAGSWVAAASSTEDASGDAYLKPATDAEIRDALSAASAVGDDRIQESTQGQVTPETWTHGSSESRQKWFLAGYKGGPDACNSFEVSDGAV